VCDAVLPDPEGVASSQFQLYVAVGCAVELLPSKLHASHVQLGAKFATGGGGDGGGGGGGGGCAETVTGCVFWSVPPASETVRVTLYVPSAL